MLFRFLTGAGIGGEYAAINSTIQELIPARVRGLDRSRDQRQLLDRRGARRDWRSIVLLDPAVIEPGIRLAARLPHRRAARHRHLLHAHVAAGKPALADDAWPRRRPSASWSPASSAACARPATCRKRTCRASGCARAVTRRSRGGPLAVPSSPPNARSASSLMAAQAFFYNAIFFTYALVLTDFYGIAAQVGWYILPFAAGNFLGPAAARAPVRHDRPQADDRLHLHHVGVLLTAAAGCSREGMLTATQQTLPGW
jgi:hypothetical protein